MTLEPRSLSPVRTWASINAPRNILLLLVGCEHLGVPKKVIFNSLPDRLKGKSISLMRKDEDQITLAEYDDVLRPLIDHLGHVSLLSEIGHASPKIDFGFETVKRIAGTLPGLGHFVSPWVAYKQLNEAARAWNNNKIWKADLIDHNMVRLMCTYNPASPTGQTIDRIKDAVSLLYLIRGMNEALPGIFPGRYLLSEVNYRLVNLPLEQLLRTLCPKSNIEFSGNVLYFNNELVATKVWLKPDHRGWFMGDYSRTEIDGVMTTPAILILKDVCTQATGNVCPGQILPLVRLGEIYQINEDVSQFSHTILDIRWNTTWADKVKSYLPFVGGHKNFQNEFITENRAVAATQQVSLEKRKTQIYTALISAIYPDKSMFQSVLEGKNLTVIDDTTVSLFVDIANFSKWANSCGANEVYNFMQPFMTGVNKIALRCHGKLCNFTGDGCAINWFGKIGPSKQYSVKRRLQFAIDASLYILKLADNAGCSVRVGISVGQTITYTIPVDKSGIQAMPVTNGVAMNMAARVQAAMKPTQQKMKCSVAAMDDSAEKVLTADGILNIAPLNIRIIGVVEEKSDTFSLFQIMPTTMTEKDQNWITRTGADTSMNMPTINSNED